jgi:hypothetical protein
MPIRLDNSIRCPGYPVVGVIVVCVQGPLRSPRDGRAAVRDIVQFVPFRDFSAKPIEALAAAVLAEVPSQLVSFMKSQNIIPKPVPLAPISPDATSAISPASSALA